MLILLFRLTEPGSAGFKLSLLNRSAHGGSGGKLTCKHLATTIIRPCVPLPIKSIAPIFLTLDKHKMNKPYQLALILQKLLRLEVEFNADGVQQISPKRTSIYQVINEARQVLRIGEGTIQSRLKEHLKDNDLRIDREETAGTCCQARG